MNTPINEVGRTPLLANTPIDDAGLTPLIAACSRGHLSCVRALLEAGADANWTDNNTGYHGLLFASELGHVEIVQLLLSQPGIKVNMSHKVEGFCGRVLSSLKCKETSLLSPRPSL